MRKYDDIDQKIANLFSGNSTQKEELDIRAWLNESSENKFQFNKLKEFWQERSVDIKLINHESKKTQIWQAYKEETKKYPSNNSRFNTYFSIWRTAAIFFFFLISGILLLYISEESGQKDLPYITKTIVKQNPVGQKSQIILPDGSKVWLNSESSISYIEDFSDSVRTVKLEGEAFFEVKRDTLHPFYVDIEDLRVSVLGTEFNVNGYVERSDITIALIKGSIDIYKNFGEKKEIRITPGYAIAYSKSDETYKTISLAEDPLFYDKNIYWKTGTLVFDGQNFEDFLTRIRRWYGVDVSWSGSPPENWQLRASFENEYLTNVLDAISFNKEFHYELNNKKLKLIFN